MEGRKVNFLCVCVQGADVKGNIGDFQGGWSAWRRRGHGLGAGQSPKGTAHTFMTSLRVLHFVCRLLPGAGCAVQCWKLNWLTEDNVGLQRLFQFHNISRVVLANRCSMKVKPKGRTKETSFARQKATLCTAMGPQEDLHTRGILCSCPTQRWFAACQWAAKLHLVSRPPRFYFDIRSHVA